MRLMIIPVLPILFWSAQLSLPLVAGHGYILDPPARSILAMVYPGQDFHSDPSYNHLNCGGRGILFGSCNGVCGVCGDPCNDPNPQHEAGGRYATGYITRHYSMGQVITVQVQITMNHFGYMEFRICANNDVRHRATHECFNQHLLEMADGSGTRYSLSSGRSGLYEVQLRLPQGLVCSQCILQWKMHGANDWGTDPVTHHSCVGCGPNQEEFYSCSDVDITSNGLPITPTSTHSHTQQTTPTPTVPSTVTCHATGFWTGIEYLNKWCTDHCSNGSCPVAYCKCP